MRILLVDPPCFRFTGYYRFYFPLGLTSIAAVLQEHGHEVLIYDAEHDPCGVSWKSNDGVAEQIHHYRDALQNDAHPVWKEFRNVLDDFRPQLMGISVLSVKIAAAKKMARLAKAYDPALPIVAGGEHVTIRPQDALGSSFDYVVRGEGEESMLRLAQQLADGESPPRVVSHSLIEDLDSLPMPALDCLRDRSSCRPVDLGLMITARGCPFHCRFCALATMWERRVRAYSVGRVVQEIELRKQRYGVEYFSFRNGTFTVNPGYVREFCREVMSRQLNIRWECLTRVDTIDDELLQAMRAAGCDMIRVGIESGSEKILQDIGKGITLSQIRTAARLLHQSGIFWSAYFMLGVPSETDETIRSTLQLIQEIDPPFVTMAKFTPLPGTEMYQEVVAAGLLDEQHTDWTWGLNQSLDCAFVRGIDREKFLTAMAGAVQFVNRHNVQRASARPDARTKT